MAKAARAATVMMIVTKVRLLLPPDPLLTSIGFLEACFRCREPLGHNSDIFMYRGITAFCSSECREEQMEVEEAKERIGRNLSSPVAAMRAPPVESSAAAKSGRVRAA